MVAQLPGHTGGFVDVVHHHNAAQQIRHDVRIAGVGLDEAGRQPGRTGKTPPEKAGLNGVQRQKGGAARVLAAEQGDAGLGGGFVLRHDVLQRAAQCRFNGDFPPRLDAQNRRHRPDDAPQTAGRRGPHDRLDRVLVAVHILFQLFQHAEALTGGVQFTAKLLLGGIGLIEGGATAFQLELHAGLHICQLLFVLGQHLPVLDGIGKVLLCLVPLGLEGLSVLGEGGQLLLRGLSGGFGGGFRHLCLGTLRRQVGHLSPQDVPAGAAGVVLAGQTQEFRVQLGQLCGQLLPCRCHGPGHGAVAFQRGGSLGAVLLACGDVLPQCGGALLVAGDVVFQHGDSAVAAGKLFCDAANIPIQALDGNGQLLCLHTDLLSLGLGGSGLPVKPLILGLSGLIVPHLTADGLPGAVDAVGPEGDFQRLPPGAELEKALGLLALFFQRADPGFQFVKDVPQTLEVLCRRSQTPLRLVFAVAVLGDAAGFLENFAALAAFCGDDLRDAALSDDGVAVPADAGVQQQLVDVLEAAELAVDGVLALAGAVVFAADDGFVSVDIQRVGAVVQRQAHHGKAHGSPAAGAAEDDVLHLSGSAKLAGAGLAQHPPHRVRQIGLTRAVGADDAGDALVKAYLDLIGETLETLNFQFLEHHVTFP